MISDFTLKDIYKVYLKDNPKDSKYYVESSLYKTICYDFNKSIMNFLIKESGDFKLPYRLGTLRIKKRKTSMNNLKVDFNATKKHGITLYHLNEHSKEWYYRFFWIKLKSNIKNKSAYSFKASRANNRELARIIKDPNNKIDFLE